MVIRALTADQTRAAEQRAVAERGATLDALMRRAGETLAETAAGLAEGDLIVLAGRGNNGGDGWVAARVLHAEGRNVRVFSLADPGTLDGPAHAAAAEAVAAGVVWHVPPAPPTADELAPAAIVIDALLGIGGAGPLREPLPDWIDAAAESGCLIVSADIPSGVDTDTGQIQGTAIPADVTVTFSALKRGLVTYPGAEYAGDVVVADVGIPPALLEFDDAPEVWEAAEYAELLPLPAADTHKDDRGRVLVVAGSSAYPGAAILAAKGAQRAGAGYVTLACPETIIPVAHQHLVAATVVGMPASHRSFSSRALERILALAHEYDAVVLGPGLTLADGAVVVARGLVAQLDKPLVVDADALNALVDAVDLVAARRSPTVLTPHPGEMGRLLGISTTAVQADRIEAAHRLANRSIAVVLKGAGTVVSTGERHVIVASGSPALATAGTGDVLSGVIGALLAAGLEPLEAAALGAYWHGRAGEAAAAALTPLSVTAEDIPGFLPIAAAELLGSW